MPNIECDKHKHPKKASGKIKLLISNNRLITIQIIKTINQKTKFNSARE